MVSKDSLKEFEDILEVAINIGAEEVLEGVDDNDHECYHFICEPKVNLHANNMQYCLYCIVYRILSQ